MPFYPPSTADAVLGGARDRITGAVTVYPANEDQFGATRSVEKTPQFSYLSAFGTSALRDVETVTNSAAISATGGEILLSTGATASSKATLASARRGNYIPGYGAEVGIGIRVPTTPTGNQIAKWGLREANNGFYFGVDATGVFVAYLDGGTETKTYQSNWNLDTLDGTGPSGEDLDISSGYIFQIEFTHYGYGDIVFSVVSTIGKTQRRIDVHSLNISGSVSIEEPNCPIVVEADNGGDAADLDVYVGGRQFSIIGKVAEEYRFTSDSRAGVATSTTLEPLVSFQKKSAFRNRTVRVDGYEAIVSTEDVLVQIYLDATLTGASFGTPGDHAAAETAMESDTSATAISGGTLIWQQLLKAGDRGATAEAFAATFDFPIPDTSTVTLAAKTLTGTGTIAANFRVEERW